MANYLEGYMLGIWLIVLISVLNLITNFQIYRMKKREMYDRDWKKDMLKEEARIKGNL